MNFQHRYENRDGYRPAVRGAAGFAAALSLGILQLSALATPPVVAPLPEPSTTQPGQPAQPESGGFTEGLSRRSYFLGDMWGLREKLSKYGVTLNIAETSEVLGNVTGGSRRGSQYEGLTQADAQLDTQRAWGHYGGTFNISALQVHGGNLSATNLHTLQTASGIEADRSTRLWELWYQQKFLQEDRLDVKVGQQSLDQEFMVSSNALLFVNTMFGWAMVPSADLPGGGPAYPLSAPGIRVRAKPTNSLTLLAGVFNGSPVSNSNGDPQLQDAYGTTFPLHGGQLAIAEAQWTYPALGAMVSADEAAPMPRTYRVGAYYDTEHFADLRYDTTGLPIAQTGGTPAEHRGNYGLYGVADRMLWISPDDADRTLSGFGRLMTQPQSDRNLVTYSMNAGLVMRDPIPRINRDDDSVGIGFGYAKVGGSAAGSDADQNTYQAAGIPVRGSESFVELTYQYQYTPWCQIQPDFQYVFNPGGGVANPSEPGKRIGNEAVLGVRVNLLF